MEISYFFLNFLLQLRTKRCAMLSIIPYLCVYALVIVTADVLFIRFFFAFLRVSHIKGVLNKHDLKVSVNYFSLNITRRCYFLCVHPHLYRKQNLTRHALMYWCMRALLAYTIKTHIHSIRMFLLLFIFY